MTPALLGVLIGASATLAASTLQLWFTSRQRERDRYMQLRRDAYFETADGLANGVAYLAQIGRADNVSAVTAMPPTTAWFYKLHLIADTDTLISFSEAGSRLATAIIDITVSRITIKEIDDEIEIVKSVISRWQELQEDVRNETRTINPEAPSTQALQRLEYLKQQRDESWREITRETARLDSLVVEHGRRLSAHAQKLAAVAAGFQRIARNAFLAARRELGLTIDAERFGSAATAIDARMTQKMDEVADLIASISGDSSGESKSKT